jgi:hypothetical protein
MTEFGRSQTQATINDGKEPQESLTYSGGMTKPSYNQAVWIVDSFDILKHFERAFTL